MIDAPFPPRLNDTVDEVVPPAAAWLREIRE